MEQNISSMMTRRWGEENQEETKQRQSRRQATDLLATISRICTQAIIPSRHLHQLVHHVLDHDTRTCNMRSMLYIVQYDASNAREGNMTRGSCMSPNGTPLESPDVCFECVGSLSFRLATAYHKIQCMMLR